MPELILKNEEQDALAPKAQTAYGIPSAPPLAYDVPDMTQRAEESIFHPVRAFNDLIDAIQENTKQINLLVKDMQRERVWIDQPVQVGKTIAYIVDYKERKYLYAYVLADTTIALSNGGSLVIKANVWTGINFPRLTQITIPAGSDAAPQTVFIRACDFLMA